MAKTKSKPNKTEEKSEIVMITCCSCGNMGRDDSYYMSRSRLFKHYRRLPICKDCMGKIFDELFDKYNSNRKAIYELCQMCDLCFNQNIYLGALTDVSKTGKALWQAYIQKINSLGRINQSGVCFSDSDSLTVDEDKSKELDDGSDPAKDLFKMSLADIEENCEFDAQDQQVKDDVVRLVGYDVFAGYSKYDQKFLYNELLTYLDEDTLEDSFKLSQIVQLINNNNQIRKIDLVINTLGSNIKSLTVNQTDIKALSAIKNQIVTATDKIAKENSISVKNRGDKSAGKSTLTYLMKNYRELGFEGAEQDYYDQNKAHGMKLVADISNKSIMEQLQFDENDYNDMLITQRNLLQQLQDKVADLEEENRQLYVRIGKLENPEE